MSEYGWRLNKLTCKSCGYINYFGHAIKSKILNDLFLAKCKFCGGDRDHKLVSVAPWGCCLIWDESRI